MALTLKVDLKSSEKQRDDGLQDGQMERSLLDCQIYSRAIGLERQQQSSWVIVSGNATRRELPISFAPSTIFPTPCEIADSMLDK